MHQTRVRRTRNGPHFDGTLRQSDQLAELFAAGLHGLANPALALLTVLGNNPLAHVTINEMTTIASVWTHAQFIDSAQIKGHALGLRIAAGNVPDFVDLATGGWGGLIQDWLNSSQTPTMANFATLADVLAGCVTRVTPDDRDGLFTAATSPKGDGQPTR